jgi:ketosteroid isomerase-like protein
MNVEVAQNVDVVQQGYEAFGRGDIPALLESLTDDVEWILQAPR